VRKVLASGVRDGWAIPKIARALADQSAEISRRRGVVIARTEVIAASNLGARAGAIDTGLSLDHAWLATPGLRTRPWHAAANGQSKDMDVPFNVGGEELMFPGDGSRGASAKNLVNCRCTVIFQPKSPS
jgi:hypothetical protein